MAAAGLLLGTQAAQGALLVQLKEMFGPQGAAAVQNLVAGARVPGSGRAATTLAGILLAHAALGAFFTATAMIGFMAGAGIVVRNSIILVDFIELRLGHGRSLRDACVESGAVRFRPMMLTAFAEIVGGLVILADPIFQGLAISLLFGAIASLLISPIAVPLIYYMTHAGRLEKPTAPKPPGEARCQVKP